MSDKAVGTAGTMRITDHGTNVEFLVLCSDGQTTVGNYTWSGVVNGVAVGGTVSLPRGFGTKSLGIWQVNTSQTVTFHQNATGTQGLGGAADHSQAITRGPAATVPPAPTGLALDEITRTSMRYTFAGNGTGGAPVTWQYNASIYPDFRAGEGTYGPEDVPGNYGYVTIGGLTPATLWHVRSRGVNSVGVGPWSNVLSARTLGGVRVSDGTTWVPWVVDVSDGTAWGRQQIDISDGTAWRPAD